LVARLIVIKDVEALFLLEQYINKSAVSAEERVGFATTNRQYPLNAESKTVFSTERLR
jgi:hypothetical protein